MAESVYIASVFEHPAWEVPDKSTMQLHADVAAGALEDAGVSKNAIDASFTAEIPEMEHRPTLWPPTISVSMSHMLTQQITADRPTFYMPATLRALYVTVNAISH